MKKILVILIIIIAITAICGGCSKNSPTDPIMMSLPTVQTGSVTNITDTTAVFNGNVIADGGTTITTRGVCWRLADTTMFQFNPEPTLNDNSIVCDGTTGSYTVNIKGLTPATNYNLRAYAINKAGVSYGKTIRFKTTSPTVIPDSLSVIPASFSIPYVSITNLETDQSGNVYVTGTFKFDAASISDIFVAKFNQDGALVWRKNIVADKYNYPHGGIVVFNDVVYVELTINDLYGTGGGDVYVNAYDCQTGEIKWSTKMPSPDNNGYFLGIGGDGYIYTSLGYFTAAIDPITGKIVKSYTQGGISPVAVTKDNIFAGGAKNSVIDGSSASLIIKFDLSFNLVWSKISTTYYWEGDVESILFFPNDSLLVTSELCAGDVMNGGLVVMSVVCYKVKNNGADLIWKKDFNASNYLVAASLKTYNNKTFYFFDPFWTQQDQGALIGPIEMNLNGDVLWTASPKKNGNIAAANGKVFLADGSNVLKIYNK